MGVEYFPPPSTSGSSSLLTGHILYVDIVNGNDGTGTAGNASKPYLTIGVAKAAASSGDLVRVRPGAYTVTDSILKDGVNWDFDAGASVNMVVTSPSSPTTILDDKGAAISCIVYGEGVFQITLNGTGDYTGCVHTNNASTNLVINARSISAVQGTSLNGIPIGVFGQSGTLIVRASQSIFATDASLDFGIAVYWHSGLNIIESPIIYASNNAVWTNTSGSASDNLYVTAKEIYTTGSGISQPGVITSFDGTNPNSAIWVTADTITANTGSDNCAVNSDPNNSNKIYVQCQKFYGDVRVQNGLTYVTATKSEALSNVTGGVTALFATCSGGALRYNVRHHDPKAFTGISHLVSGGTFISNEIEYTAGSGSNGLSISSGTAWLNTAYLNTAANSGGNPVAKSGGVLVLNASILVAEGASESITAGSSQDVVAMGCWTNRDMNVNVTVTTSGGLTIDSSVI